MVELEVEDYNEILVLARIRQKVGRKPSLKGKKDVLQTYLPRRRQDKGRNGPARHGRINFYIRTLYDHHE